MKMTAYLGQLRTTEIECEVEMLCDGVGRTICFECDGDGDWTKFYPEPEKLITPMHCVNCKGTGKVLISV